VTGKAALLSLVGIAAAVHLAWVDATGRGNRQFTSIKRLVGVALVAAALISFYQTAYEREGIAWVRYDPQLLTSASREGKPAILDFYADWCGPCRALEKGPFRDPEVVRLSKDFVTLRVDLTTTNKKVDQILAQYGIRGVPTVIFLGRDGREERGTRIESLVGKGEVLERMKRVRRQN